MTEQARRILNTYQRTVKSSARRTISAQRRDLAKIARYAEKLGALLDGLGAEVGIQLSPRVGDLFAGQHYELLKKLKDNAKRAHKVLAHAKRDAPKDPALTDLLSRLSNLWWREFPEDHGVTKRSDSERKSGEYRGPRLEFVRRLINDEGIKCTGLGQRLYKIKRPWARG